MLVVVIEPNCRRRQALCEMLNQMSLDVLHGANVQEIYNQPDSRKVSLYLMDGSASQSDIWNLRKRCVEDGTGFVLSSGNPSSLLSMLPDDAFDSDTKQMIGGSNLFTVRKPFHKRDILSVLGRVLLRTHPNNTSVVAVRATEKLENLRVLVVEDNAINQKMAVRMLKRLGIDPQVVPDGKAAVDAIEGQDYDVVLMDIMMPVMGGVEATHKIRQMEGKRQPWIIALTADAIASHHDTYLTAGMDNVLTKPVDATNLKETIKFYVGKLRT